MEKPNLWHVRITGLDNPKFYHYREDLAKNRSIIKIGYNLSKDVRGFLKEKNYVNLLREQLKKDNPIQKGVELRSYNSGIGQYLGVVKNFMEIKKGDYIISPYYRSPNGNKVSIGHVTGELEILENLMEGKLNSFAQNYKNVDYIIASAKNLVFKVEWDAELFEKDLLDNRIQEQIKNRRTIISLNFPGKLPCGLASKSVFKNGVCP